MVILQQSASARRRAKDPAGRNWCQNAEVQGLVADPVAGAAAAAAVISSIFA